MRKMKFKQGDTAYYNGYRVKVTSVRRELSIKSANGNLYYRIRKPKSNKYFTVVRSDILHRT